RNYGPVLQGTWRVVAAAGTYNLHTQRHAVPSASYVYIEGPDVGGTPNVPTCVMDGAGFAPYEHGMRIEGVGVQAWVQNILFQNYDAGASTSIGLATDYGAALVTTNVHAS